MFSDSVSDAGHGDLLTSVTGWRCYAAKCQQQQLQQQQQRRRRLLLA